MKNLEITQAITNRDSRSTEAYLGEIGKVDLISAEQEVILARKIKEGDLSALEKLTRANLRFVVSVAKKYQHQGLPLCDLISEGNLGLLKAAQRFDETRGFKFISFAVWWIRQSILAAISENARIIRLPMNKVNEITKINKALAIVEQQTLREPTSEQLAAYLKTTPEKINDSLYYAPWTKSIDAPIGGTDEFSMLDNVALDCVAPDHALLAESFTMEINYLLSSLSKREREIIEPTYGIKGGKELSPSDIAGQVGLTTERIRQIRNMALVKMRDISVHK